jgi:hypothetical protein
MTDRRITHREDRTMTDPTAYTPPGYDPTAYIVDLDSGDVSFGSDADDYWDVDRFDRGAR